MKNLRITEDCLYQGEHTPAGTVLENVDTTVAAELVSTGRAEEVSRVVTRDPEVTTRDPEPSPEPDKRPKEKPAKEKAPADK